MWRAQRAKRVTFLTMPDTHTKVPTKTSMSRPLWFRVDCSDPSSPALDYLHEQGEHAACWLWLMGNAYAAERLTDGFVPHGLPKRWGFKDRHAQLLTDLGLWKEWEEGPTYRGWVIQGFLDRNVSREEWEAKILQRRNAALRRWAGGR